jgi:hypothetical protein
VFGTFANAAKLASISTGTALTTTPAGNGTVPIATIGTLANLLAECTSSSGPSSTGCDTLYSNAESNGSTGTAPTETATAAINIAHNPGANIANHYTLPTPSEPFQPSLSSPPNDFTIAVSYTGGGLNSPVPVAIDASGNIWIGNTATGVNTVSELSPVGAPISTSAGYSGGGIVDPYSIAIDKSGNVWTANITPDSLSELENNVMPISTSAGYTQGGLNAPYAIAFDSLGHAWVVNNVGSSLSEFSSTGTAITTSSGYTGGGISNDPVSLAIDASGNVWVTDSITLGTLSEFNSAGATPGSPISSSTGYTGGGLNIPEGIAIDGAGNVWVVNRASTQIDPPFPDSSISEFNSSGIAISPSTGYQAGLNISLRVAVDGSGNVWVPNATLNTVTEFVGAGSPVVTPIVANLLNPYGSHAVNKP